MLGRKRGDKPGVKECQTSVCLMGFVASDYSMKSNSPTV